MRKNLLFGILVVIGINYPVFCTDSIEDVSKIAVAESVKLAVEMRTHDPMRSQKLWTHAYEASAKALKGEDPGVDLKGKVESVPIFNVNTGVITKQYDYNDELPLDKRVALLATEVARTAEINNDFLNAATFYAHAATFFKDLANAQIWHRGAATNYEKVEMYDQSYEHLEMAAKIAINYYPNRTDYICLIKPIADDCLRMKQTCEINEKPELAESFLKIYKKLSIVQGY